MENNNIKSMKLYNFIDRVYNELRELGKATSGPLSVNELSSFDQLHYHGTQAIDFAIKNKMTPGVQLLIAKNGSVIYNKSYGHHTYNKKISVKNEDIYDLASITKILVSVPLIIREIELKSLNFDTSLSSLFPKTNLHAVSYTHLTLPTNREV